jgi:hypothetical protein
VRTALVLACAALLTALWWSWDGGAGETGPATPPPAEAPGTNPATVAGMDPATPSDAADERLPGAGRSAVSAPTPAAPTTSTPALPAAGAVLEVTVWERGSARPVGDLELALRRNVIHAPCWRARSDAQGRASWRDLAPGEYHLGTARGGDQVVSLTAASCEQLELWIEGGRRLSGSVVDAHGRGLPAALEFQFADGSGVWRQLGTAAASGSFDLLGPSAAGALRARTPEQVPSPPVAVPAGDGQVVALRLRCGGEAGRLRVAVSAAGAISTDLGTVHLVPRWHLLPTAVEPRSVTVPGEVVFDSLAPGNYEVAVDLPPWRLRRAAVSIVAAAQTELELDLLPGPSLAVQVSDTEGQPLAGALVSVGDPDERGARTTRSGEGGLAWLEGLDPGPLQVQGRVVGHRPALLALVVPAAGPVEPVELRLAPAGGGPRVDGVVVDRQGWPVAGIEVHGFDADDPAASPTSTTTDERGRFDLAAGERLRLELELRRPSAFAAPLLRERVAVGGPPLVLVVDTAAEHRPRLRVELLRADGAALAGARLRALRRSGATRVQALGEGLCDDRGRAQFELSEARIEWLDVEHPDCGRVCLEVTAEASDEGLVELGQLRLGQPAELSVELPARPAGYEALASLVHDLGGTLATQPLGDRPSTWSLGALGPGEYRVEVYSLDGSSGSATVALAAGELRTVALTLE